MTIAPLDARDSVSIDGRNGDHAQSPPMRVLVVDDNRDLAEGLGMLLEHLGAEVRLAFDGSAALEEFDRSRPALVLLDIGMPKMDGYEVARAIRQRPYGAHAVLIALTGSGMDEDIKRAEDAGFDRHLTKPVSMRSIETLLGSVAFRRSQGPAETT